MQKMEPLTVLLLAVALTADIGESSSRVRREGFSCANGDPKTLCCALTTATTPPLSGIVNANGYACTKNGLCLAGNVSVLSLGGVNGDLVVGNCVSNGVTVLCVQSIGSCVNTACVSGTLFGKFMCTDTAYCTAGSVKSAQCSATSPVPIG